MAALKFLVKVAFAILFITLGMNHFRQPVFWASTIPPYLPWHLALVYISGVAEIGLAILLFVPRFSRLAAWGLVALLIAVFPANIHMALHPEQFPQMSPASLWRRLPLQPVFIACMYWLTRPTRTAVKATEPRAQARTA